MNRLYRAPGKSIFYLLDDEVDWPEGELELQDLRKRTISVDPDAVAPHAIAADEAKQLAMAEMAAVRDAVKAGAAQFASLARTIRTRAWEAEDSVRDAARALGDRPSPAPPEVGEGLKRGIAQAGAALQELLTAPDTPDGVARLTRIAASIRDAGGPDWTEDPAAIPGRLRSALQDPALAERLGALWSEIREQAPVASGPPGAARTDPSHAAADGVETITPTEGSDPAEADEETQQTP